jgi:hypothetical protein
MLPAVHLDNQPRIKTDEVDNVGADQHLSPKLEIRKTRHAEQTKACRPSSACARPSPRVRRGCGRIGTLLEVLRALRSAIRLPLASLPPSAPRPSPRVRRECDRLEIFSRTRSARFPPPTLSRRHRRGSPAACACSIGRARQADQEPHAWQRDLRSLIVRQLLRAYAAIEQSSHRRVQIVAQRRLNHGRDGVPGGFFMSSQPDRDEIAERLRHLLAFDLQEAVVHPGLRHAPARETRSAIARFRSRDAGTRGRCRRRECRTSRRDASTTLPSIRYASRDGPDCDAAGEGQPARPASTASTARSPSARL